MSSAAASGDWERFREHMWKQADLDLLEKQLLAYEAWRQKNWSDTMFGLAEDNVGTYIAYLRAKKE